jgi:hypothetical protein
MSLKKRMRQIVKKIVFRGSVLPQRFFLSQAAPQSEVTVSPPSFLLGLSPTSNWQRFRSFAWRTDFTRIGEPESVEWTSS